MKIRFYNNINLQEQFVKRTLRNQLFLGGSYLELLQEALAEIIFLPEEDHIIILVEYGTIFPPFGCSAQFLIDGSNFQVLIMPQVIMLRGHCLCCCKRLE